MADVDIPSYEARADRPCIGCGKRDKAYRDQVNLQDGNVVLYHADCHVMVADCETCKKVLEAAGTDHTNNGLKDEDLHVAIHRSMAAQHEVFTSESVVPQVLPNA